MAPIEIKPVREVMKVIQPIVDAANARCWLEGGSGSHPKLYVEINGRSLFTPISTSPRCQANAIKYKVSDVKRIIRELTNGST